MAMAGNFTASYRTDLWKEWNLKQDWKYVGEGKYEEILLVCRLIELYIRMLAVLCIVSLGIELHIYCWRCRVDLGSDIRWRITFDFYSPCIDGQSDLLSISGPEKYPTKQKNQYKWNYLCSSCCRYSGRRIYIIFQLSILSLVR